MLQNSAETLQRKILECRELRHTNCTATYAPSDSSGIPTAAGTRDLLMLTCDLQRG